MSFWPLLARVRVDDHELVHAQIVLFDGFDPLDVIAPFEVLAAGSDAVGGELEVVLVSAEGPRPVVSGTRGLVLTRPRQLDPTKSGYVIMPGASGPIAGDPDDGVETIPVLLARFGETAGVDLMRARWPTPTSPSRPSAAARWRWRWPGCSRGATPSPITSAWTCSRPPGSTSSTRGWSTTVTSSPRGGVTSGLELALHLLDRSYGPRVALAVEALFAHERRGTVWTAAGRTPVEV